MNKKQYLFFSFVLILLFTCATWFNNYSFASNLKVKVVSSQVNLRKTPWGEVIGTLKKGEVFSILEQKNDSYSKKWYKVNKSGKKGYVHSDVVKIFDPDAPVDKTLSNTKIIIKASELNFRKLPMGTVISRVKKGQVFKAYASRSYPNGNKWYKIKHNGEYGYVISSYVRTEPLKPVYTDKPLSNANIKINVSELNFRVKPWGNIIGRVKKGWVFKARAVTKDTRCQKWYKIKYNGKLGYVYGGYVVPYIKKNVKVTTHTLKFRKVPWGTVIGYVHDGDVFSVISEKKGYKGKIWYKIKHNGKYGYIHSNFTIGVEGGEAPCPVSEGKIYVTNVDYLNVRKSPWGEVIGHAREWSEFYDYDKVKSSKGDYWNKIRYKGKFAYISNYYVTKVTESSSSKRKRALFKRHMDSYLKRKGISNKVGILFADENGRYYHNSKDYFYGASTTKIPVAMKIVDLIDEGKLSWKSKIGSDGIWLYEKGDGHITNNGYNKYRKYTVEDLMYNLIYWSDNTAMNIFRHHLGDAAYRNKIDKYSSHELKNKFYSGNFHNAQYMDDVQVYLYNHKEKYKKITHLMSILPTHYVTRHSSEREDVKVGLYKNRSSVFLKYYTNNPFRLNIMTRGIGYGWLRKISDEVYKYKKYID